MLYHYRLMNALDASQMAGQQFTPLHRAIRQAMREAQMSGATLDSALDLGAYVAKRAPDLKQAAEAFAA